MIVGDYRYSSALIDGRRFAIVRNGDQLLRVREILKGGNPVIWDGAMPMRSDVLDILKSEAR